MHDFASTATPQQVGESESDGKTLAGMVQCILADWGLPKFMWGELMQAAVYSSNRAPHGVLRS